MHAHACRLVHTILLGTARQPVYYFYSISTQLLLAAPAAPMVDFPLTTYATLLPVVAGVSIASLSELTFSWTSFLGAMGSNTAFLLRAILSKMQMGKPLGENMDAANLYAVVNPIKYLHASLTNPPEPPALASLRRQVGARRAAHRAPNMPPRGG